MKELIGAMIHAISLDTVYQRYDNEAESIYMQLIKADGSKYTLKIKPNYRPENECAIEYDLEEGWEE